MEKVKRMTLIVWGERHKILRFLVSGGFATGADFFFLYAFTEWAGFYYLISSILAFFVSVSISFTLQKFWTFRNTSKEDMHKQAIAYFALAFLNLAVNTVLLFVLVEYGGLHYLLAQFCSSALIAIGNFFMYRFVIFKHK